MGFVLVYVSNAQAAHTVQRKLFILNLFRWEKADGGIDAAISLLYCFLYIILDIFSFN